jgi:hypothetical protein
MAQIIQTNRRPQETGGYCALCNCLVPRDEQARCKKDSHPAELVRGLVDLTPEGELPYSLPRFNWAAALMPPLWGPAHGAWSGALVLPLLLFADSVLQSAVGFTAAATLWQKVLVWAVTAGVFAGTLMLMYRFGRRGWGIAWSKAYAMGASADDSRSLDYDTFLKRERLWLAVSLPLLILLLSLAVYWWTHSPL